jgi:hypothetical protein
MIMRRIPADRASARPSMSSMSMTRPSMTHPGARALDRGFCGLLLGSHARLVGSPLVPPDWSDRQGGTDPRFIYANNAAQSCFEYDWAEMTSLRSRFSAGPSDREERQRLLDAVSRQGFISDYRGMRIAKSGRRFWIENATVWELIDEAGRRHGQAAAFRQWRDA